MSTNSSSHVHEQSNHEVYKGSIEPWCMSSVSGLTLSSKGRQAGLLEGMKGKKSRCNVS